MNIIYKRKNNLSLNNMNIVKLKLPLETDIEPDVIFNKQNGGDVEQNDQPDQQVHPDSQYDQHDQYDQQNHVDYPQNNQREYSRPNDLMYMDASKVITYTIPIGTLLYHGTMIKETFNPFDIKLGDDNLVAYFSPNKRLSSDYIMGCAMYPNKTGYIHKFRVKKEITKVIILSAYEKRNNWDLSHINNIYCNNKTGLQANGIGFFYPKKENEAFDDMRTFSQSQMIFDSEFALCDPNEYLEYLSTQRCQSSRKLSNEYYFPQ